MPLIKASEYKISVTTANNSEVYEAECSNDADPGESVAAVQVLFPLWTEILIERVEHPYTEKK